MCTVYNYSLGGSIYANARKMTNKEISRFFGDEEWHDTNEKEIWINTGDKLE